MLALGAKAPDFELPDHTGRNVSLRSLVQRGPAVIFFYPGDFTPICTREACLVRDIHADLAEAGITIAGISADSPEKHARFKEHYGLGYPLLADVDKKVIELYGVAGPLGLVRRASFLIGPNRTVRDRLCADFRLARHKAFLERALGA
jgi:peroxiredoxin Q/BCP